MWAGPCKPARLSVSRSVRVIPAISRDAGKAGSQRFDSSVKVLAHNLFTPSFFGSIAMSTQENIEVVLYEA